MERRRHVSLAAPEAGTPRAWAGWRHPSLGHTGGKKGAIQTPSGPGGGCFQNEPFKCMQLNAQSRSPATSGGWWARRLGESWMPMPGPEWAVSGEPPGGALPTPHCPGCPCPRAEDGGPSLSAPQPFSAVSRASPTGQPANLCPPTPSGPGLGNIRALEPGAKGRRLSSWK